MLSFPKQGTPITIGMFGHWGAGKSSVMQLLQKELSHGDTRKDYPAFEFLFGWFNAWEYEHTENIRAGLAQEVVNGLLSDGTYQPKLPQLTQPVSRQKRFRIQWRFIWSEKRQELYQFLGKALLALITVLVGACVISEKPIPGTGITGLGVFFLFKLVQQFHEGGHPIATELGTFFKLPSYRKELGQVPVIKDDCKGLEGIRWLESENLVVSDGREERGENDEDVSWRHSCSWSILPSMRSA